MANPRAALLKPRWDGAPNYSQRCISTQAENLTSRLTDTSKRYMPPTRTAQPHHSMWLFPTHTIIKSHFTTRKRRRTVINSSNQSKSSTTRQLSTNGVPPTRTVQLYKYNCSLHTTDQALTKRRQNYNFTSQREFRICRRLERRSHIKIQLFPTYTRASAVDTAVSSLPRHATRLIQTASDCLQKLTLRDEWDRQ
jgi:hypothetical protein